MPGFEKTQTEHENRQWDEMANPKSKYYIDEEQIQTQVVDELTATALRIPGWTKAKDLEFDEKKHQWDKPRMKRALDIQDELNSSRPKEDVWREMLQKEIAGHLLTMKILVADHQAQGEGGARPKLMDNLRVTSVEPRKDSQLRGDSFFSLDTANMRWSDADVMIAKFSVTAGCDIDNVQLEMSLLERGWPACFEEAALFDEKQYSTDPSWDIITPENLLLRAKGDASLKDTREMDRLLQYAPKQDEFIKGLGNHVSSAYLREGDGCDHLLRLLPDKKRMSLQAQKNPSTLGPKENW